MKLQKQKIGDKLVWPFTIPSGIVMTDVKCAERILSMIPEIGIWTTKSIGPEPRIGNKEPILAQYIPGGFVNAVGLTNSGAEEYAKKLSSTKISKDKFLLASIFGKNRDEFVFVAKTLDDYVDGFELNLSCPHAKGYGMQLGQDPEIVTEIVRAITGITKKPIFAKLTPNAGNIGEIAKSALSAGAYGITAINTIGPGYHSVDGLPVLTNEVGGLSGIGITPIGLKCVRDVRKAVGKDIPIIGMGGIRNVADIEEYAEAGATFFGIGSALAGMNEREIKNYFNILVDDLRSNGWTNNAESLLKKIDMQYKKVRVEKKEGLACDFKIIQTNEIINAEPGQFVFAWIPRIGEKPFSIMNNNPLTLGILEKGEFTKKINSLQKGDSFYVRGPYGRGVDVPQKSNIVLVGGGCGIVGLYPLAKRFSRKANVSVLLAAKDKKHIAYLNDFRKYGKVLIATEDGSLGKKGLVTDLMDDLKEGSYFFNCGPRAMINAVLNLELKVSNPDRVYSSIDYMTRCGVGVCGSCADEKGRRTCVEGPFMNS